MTTIVERPFVKYSDEYNQNVLKKAREEAGMTDEDCHLVVQFVRSKAGKKLSDGRKRVLFSKLTTIRRYLKKDFLTVTHDDLLEFCDNIGKDFKPNTCNETKSVLKEFYRYLIKQKLTDITPDDLAEIQKERVESKLSPDDLLTPEEIKAMLDSTSNTMHKALIATLAESGARIHEAAGLRWKDLKFDTAGCVLSLTSKKTSQRRYVRLRNSVPYLAIWKNQYRGCKPELPVFITERGTTLVYETCRATIARIAEKAGVKKKVTPHLFRHTRVTELLKLGMREPELKKSLWGSVSTSMLANYEHLAQGDVDAEYKRVLGIEDETEKPKPTLSSVQCPNCHAINTEGSEDCRVCGLPMNGEAPTTITSELDALRAQMAQMQEAMTKYSKMASQRFADLEDKERLEAYDNLDAEGKAQYRREVDDKEDKEIIKHLKKNLE